MPKEKKNPANADERVMAGQCAPVQQPRDARMHARLRLEWIEAGSLAENPLNWRRHSEEQLQSIRELLADPEIGWAGVCLYNERTRRLIDGHARKSVVDPKAVVPVLVGDWSEEAEHKILATLDPVGAMAAGDAAAYEALIKSVEADGLWVRDLLQQTMRSLDAAAVEECTPDGTEENGSVPALPQMECQPFEHYDYLMLLFRNDQDFQAACEKLGIQRVGITYPGGTQKIGLGRVIDGPKAVRLLEERGAQKGGAQ
jgi:hypothetical protein